MKKVILISAVAEWNAVKLLFPGAKIEPFPYGECFNASIGNHNLGLFHSGWGKIASAGAMQYVIDKHLPDLIINLGTCGGIEGAVRQGDVILVDKTLVYDIVELMEGPDVAPYYASSLNLNWLAEPYPHPVRRGMIASADSDLLPEKIPFLKSHGAIVSDWESGALAWVAQRNKTRLLILRGVSDMVSDQGSEAYDHIEIFHQRAKQIMRELIGQLPDWLDAVRL